MSADAPIIVGGSGHSGTRAVIDVVSAGGVFTGVNRLTKRPDSGDLRILGLLDTWVGKYINGSMSSAELSTMKRKFARRLRIYFPIRSKAWGFKNPRTMLLLPFLHDLFPSMRFVHVIRDGRDIALGNPLSQQNQYAAKFLSPLEQLLSTEEKMILYWGRANEKARDFASSKLPDRYLLVRWEDLCRSPRETVTNLLEFCSCPAERVNTSIGLIARPTSMGRWKTFPPSTIERLSTLGKPWLKTFGYE
jgi:hypothetical protein